MFTVTYVSSEDSKVSKAEILRGIISEKLTAAAREIFAVVERTVAGYEEEASGLRQEVDRQRRQLEVVLQPRVSLCRIGLQESKEEEEEPAQSPDLNQEVLKEENDQTPPRTTEGTGSGNRCRTPDGSDEGLTESKTDSVSSNTKRKRSVRGSSLRSPVNSATDSEGEAHEKKLADGDDDWRPSLKVNQKKQRPLKLSVCFLDNCPAVVLSKTVFKRCPIQELLCPHGLQEADFLNLLRSTFPQLAADKPFDVFMTDRTRRLQPLKVETLTPEEICRALRSTGAGKSSLYIRLKTGEELQASGQLDLLPKNAFTKSPSTSASVMTSDETRQHTSSIVHVLARSSASQQEVMETKKAADDEDAGISKPTDDVQASSFANSVDENEEDIGDEEETNDSDDDCRKPDVTEDKLQEREVKSYKTRRKGGRKRIRLSPQVLTENSDAVVSCKVCGVLYKSKNIVIRHAWSHVDDPKRLCGVCGEHSESAEELRSHLQSHLKTHICSICGKTFIRLNDFMEHTAGHTGQTPHKCDVCGKGFFFKRKLTAHQKVHLVGKHTCYICQKKFSSQAELKLHNSVHTEKRYRCSVCGKSLGILKSLSQHMLSHSGEKRYGCEVCGKHFVSVVYLKKHEKIHTVREKSYLCDFCCKAFHTITELKCHLRIHNEQRLHACSKCGKAFASRFTLLSHMKVHSEERPYSCSDCGRSFKYSDNLKQHRILHSGEKKFVCGICGKACARAEHLTIHMRTHNGERPYKCTVCDKAFTQSHCLKTHMKSHQRKAI